MTRNRYSGLKGALMALAVAASMSMPILALAQTPAPPKTVVVLVDLSDSTKEWRQEFLSDFRLLLDHMNGGDKLLVSRIIRNPSAADTLPIHVTLPAESFGANPRKALQERLVHLTGALMDFEKVLQTVESATPIVEVLEKVPRWFQSFPNDRKIVVLMSDMREYSPSTANFESSNGWKPASLDAFLVQLGKKQLIADLTGVRIYVAGARDKDENRLRAVRGFWQRYFTEAKAEFAANRYESRLVQFDECNSADACKSTVFREKREGEIRKFVELRRPK